MRTSIAAAATFIILVALSAIVRSNRPAPIHVGLAPGISETLFPELGVTSRASELEEVDWRSRVSAWLPKDYNLSEENPANWIELEAVLIAHPDAVRAILLESYGSEANPAYKGLLAIVLSADPSNQDRILDDVQTHVGEDWLLFRALAFHSLVKTRRLTADDARTNGAVKHWKDLFTYARLTDLEYSWKRQAEQNGEEEPLRLNCSASMDLLDATCRISDLTSPVTNPKLIAVLEAEYESDDYSTLFRFTARKAMERTATEDPGFARSLVRRYLESGLRSRAITGLDFLSWAPIPEDSIPIVDELARRSIPDRDIFKDSVEILGRQKKAITEKSLLGLYALTQERTEAREIVLEAMAWHGGESFVPVAETLLVSSDPRTRVRSLQMMAGVVGQRVRQHVLTGLTEDSCPQVRYAALKILQVRNTWDPVEEDALKMASKDPDGRVRRFATGLVTAPIRKDVGSTYYSDWDCDRPDREEE